MSDRAILIVQHRVPYPVEIGSDVVSFALLRVLQHAFPVTLVAVDDGDRAGQGAEHLRGLGVEVMLTPRDRSVSTRPTAAGSVVRNARLLFAGIPRHLQSQSCRNVGPLLQELTGRRRFALAQFEYWATAGYRRFVHGPAALLNFDAWFRTVEAFARYERSPVYKLFLRLEARAVRRYEMAVQSNFEWSLFLSEEDRRELTAGPPAPRTAVLPVPLPFEPQDPALLEAQRLAPRVLFVGAMNVEFNIDAVCYFVERIWPAVRRAVPEALFTIAGRSPAERVRRLDQYQGVQVDGTPDLDALLRTSQVAVSPARIGTGIKVKVAQAMASGLPVVGTPAGLSGFGHVDCLLRAGDPGAFAEHVVRLLQDHGYRQRTGRACYVCYRDQFWMESARPKVVALYEHMMDGLEQPDAARAMPSSTAKAARC
jgi:glycosyltransferase involved in cell wall biosynthesis